MKFHDDILGAGTIQVWTSVLDSTPAAVARSYGLLSAHERQRAGRFHSLVDRNRYIVAHGWLRDRLSSYCGGEPGTLLIDQTPTGKPMLVLHDGTPSAIKFNLSHSGDRCTLAVSMDREVGVDIESLDRDVDYERLAERFFAAAESARIAQTPQCDRLKTFFRYWVGKEAILKGKGTGLTASLSHVQLEFIEPDIAVVCCQERGGRMETWGVRYLALGSECVAAVAAQGIDWRVSHCDEVL